MFFGPGSLANNKPAPNSNGIRLGFKAITSSSMAATAISVRTTPRPGKFEPFTTVFSFALFCLRTRNGIRKAPSPALIGELNTGHTWNYSSQVERTDLTSRVFSKPFTIFVFAGADTAIHDDPTEDADDADELNELMRRFELGADGSGDDGAGPAPGPAL
jgi:hypothetical protein